MTKNVAPHVVTQKPKLAWGPTAAIMISLVAYIVSQVVLVLSVIPIAVIGKDTNIDTLLSDSPWINLVLTGVSSVALVAVLWLFLRHRKQSFKDLGFRKIRLSDFGWLGVAAVAYIIVLAITMTLASKIPGFNADQVQDIGYKTAQGWQLALAFIGLVVLPPIAEEMLFRGFLYRGLASQWPKIIAALFTSILFGVVHFQWNVSVDVFVLSLILIALYEKTKNLWMCIFLHALKNGIAFLMLFVFIN
jgi:membrane protease YdiL (CAAX protease family)